MRGDEAAAILGVELDAPEEVIRRAYHSAVRKSPPSLDPEGFKRLSAAHEVLCSKTAVAPNAVRPHESKRRAPSASVQPVVLHSPAPTPVPPSVPPVAPMPIQQPYAGYSHPQTYAPSFRPPAASSINQMRDMPWWWWPIAVLGGIPALLLTWAVVRSYNPPAAKKVVLVTLAIWFGLGFLQMMVIGSMGY